MAIRTRNLGKTYNNGVIALQDLDLSVEKGNVFGFLGPNGAGKTTTVRLLNGTLTPTTGSSTVLGLSSRDGEIRRKTATLAESARMYDYLTARRNLAFFASLYGLEDGVAAKRIPELLDRMGLGDKADVKLGGFSTGMMKRLQLARTLLHEPELLFLDEPTSGLDPDAAFRVIDLIRSLADDTGVTVFLCTHNLPLAEGVCDSFGLIKEGRLVVAGSKGELTRGLGQRPVLEIETKEGIVEIPLADEGAINTHVRAVLDDDRSILSVNVREPDLHQVYFHYIGRSEDELV